MARLYAINIGTIGWFDLTELNADALSDFYRAAVTGGQECDLGGCTDYVMTHPGNGKDAASRLCVNEEAKCSQAQRIWERRDIASWKTRTELVLHSTNPHPASLD